MKPLDTFFERQQSRSPSVLINQFKSEAICESPSFDPMASSMCSSPEPSNFAVPSSSRSDSSPSRHGRKRDLIPQRKQREFTPDTRKDDTYWDRRRRNNEAAKRSREKRRMNDMVLETRVMELTTENNWLKAELNAIRDKCGIPKDAPPLVNPGVVASSASLVQQQQQQQNFTNSKDQFGQMPMMSQIRNSPVQMMQNFNPARGVLPMMRTLPPMQCPPSMHHPAMGHLFAAIPNQHMYIPGNMVQYNRVACQSVSPSLPRSCSSSGSRESPCRSDSDPRENGGAISPSIAAVSSLLKLANSHFNGYPHLPREEDSDVSAFSNSSPQRSDGSYEAKRKPDDDTYPADVEVNNHLPLKLRHKTRMESSCSPPLSKTVSSSNTNSTTFHDEDEDMEGFSGDSAVDVTECHESTKRNVSENDVPSRRNGNLQTENVQLRGELQRLASEVANLKVMMYKPDGSPAPPAPKKQRKTRNRRSSTR